MKHIKLEILVGISDFDYIDPSLIKQFVKEDFKTWFDACFYDGDSEDRAVLLATNVETDYEEDLDSLIDEDDWEDADIGDLDDAMG